MQEHNADRNSSPAESRFGTCWRAWAVSIFVAVDLSVAATLLLGGSFSPGAGDSESGVGGKRPACCPGSAGAGRGGR